MEILSPKTYQKIKEKMDRVQPLSPYANTVRKDFIVRPAKQRMKTLLLTQQKPNIAIKIK
jgi:hypothetical protein